MSALPSSARRLVYRLSQPAYADPSLWDHPPKPECLAVAISAQAGSGALDIAQRLSAYLQAMVPSRDRPWRVFDKSLMAKVLEDHHLPSRLVDFLPEDASSLVEDAVEELLGLHPPSWVIVQHSIKTVLTLVRAGNVILVGWGVNAITANLPNVLHVRLVGSLERRTARVQKRDHVSREEALMLISRLDRGRERYVKRHFGQHPSDALLYHLAINTDRFTEDEVARLIASTAINMDAAQMAARATPLRPASGATPA
jgi:cytidylate kinase